MKIDRHLNLVVEIERDGGSIFLHSEPIARAVFEANYLLIGSTHSELFGRGAAYAITSGPRIAALAMADAGTRNAAERGEGGDGGATALLTEIRRLTNVSVGSPTGWETLPVDVALARGLLDADEWSEAVNILVFFTLICWMTKRAMLPTTLEKMAAVLGARIVSSNATAFSASLPTSTPAEHSAKLHRSSVPY